VRAARIVIPAVLVGLAIWAFAPLRPPAMTGPDAPVRGADAAPVTLAALNTAAFRAPLWVVPPAPPPPPQPVAPPPPLKLQLLAIIHEGGLYRAMLYDPDSDKILVGSEGQALGMRTLERVTATGVQIRDGTGLRTLVLSQDQGRVP
jgi:hypothetical protein